MAYLELQTKLVPKGDQLQAITKLVSGIKHNYKEQTLLGITGSGKTFTMANIISQIKKTALILAPNKTLASQLFAEMQEFFPNDEVCYFVSYYDFYRPESYMPTADVFIEKEAVVNKKIEQMRYKSTCALLENKPCIIVASVSCIYGLGSKDNYVAMTLVLELRQIITIKDIARRLVELAYKHNELDRVPGTFSYRGETIDVYPSYEDSFFFRIVLDDDAIEMILKVETLTNQKSRLDKIKIYANSLYITPTNILQGAINSIKDELQQRLINLRNSGKELYANRLEDRTLLDIEMLTTTGVCPGIENYSRYLSRRLAGEPPPTLFEYIPHDALLFVDESHIAISQIVGMYNGDQARKRTLVEYGFRLPSCLDNRPLQFSEFDLLKPYTIYVSATPSNFEIARSQQVVEQIVRPTALLDPICIVKNNDNCMREVLLLCKERIARDERVLITTLTKKMSEHLTEYLQLQNLKVTYMHSDIQTLERVDIINKLKSGDIDIIVGINLLREGLDIPECSLVIILDADRQGFLRSRTSLIQTIGRAARHLNGTAVMFADSVSGSMQEAIDETTRRRARQESYNLEHNLQPTALAKKSISLSSDQIGEVLSYVLPVDSTRAEKAAAEKKIRKEGMSESYLGILRNCMLKYAEDLNFEQAAKLRDLLSKLKKRS